MHQKTIEKCVKCGEAHSFSIITVENEAELYQYAECNACLEKMMLMYQDKCRSNEY